jgi:spore coat protein A, manganese oxidase
VRFGNAHRDLCACSPIVVGLRVSVGAKGGHIHIKGNGFGDSMRAAESARHLGLCIGAVLFLGGPAWGQVAGGSLDPTSVPKFVTPLFIPGVMPEKGAIQQTGSVERRIPYYEIEVTQFDQQILPVVDANGVATGMPPTAVWSYAAVGHPETRTYPAFTVEARRNVPTRIKWINNLKDPETGHYLPHLLPIDQTLHWANPEQLECAHGGGAHPDCRPLHPPQTSYTGPVPIVTHLHGAHVTPESDGFPQSWYLPAATNLPPGIATRGSLFGQIAGVPLEDGAAVFQYPNDQAPAGLWFHDHTLGLTRTNVYVGPVGFYIIRDPAQVELGLPGPASLPTVDLDAAREARAKLSEISLVIQDRSFNTDGSLFYPDSRDFFEGLPNGTLASLGVRFSPDTVAVEPHEHSDVAPIWQPEFFGNTLVVNGNTWPQFEVNQRRYRLRILNGSGSRFFLLRLQNESLPFVQIGGDQGFLPRPVTQSRLLVAPSERVDVIVDFSGVPAGTRIMMENIGPDEPFGGGEPCLVSGSTPGDGSCDYVAADPNTTGLVMAFDVVAGGGPDRSRVPCILPTDDLNLVSSRTRQVTLNEASSATERVCLDANAELVLTSGTANDATACAAVGGTLEPFAPSAANLGTLDAAGNSAPLLWSDAVTENPALGATETWEIFNFTADAHPIHLHLVRFRVLDRQTLVQDADGMSVQPAQLVPGAQRPPEPSETGFKDTAIAYPGQVLRLQARFDTAGLFVWHCHILEHEDNEMMRPFCVGDQASCPLPIATPLL